MSSTSKYKVERTIRHKSKTYLNGDVVELTEEEAQKMFKQGHISELDKEILAKIEESTKETIVYKAYSYEGLKKLSHKELDALAEGLEVETKGTIEEKSQIIWEYLSTGYEKVEPENEDL